MDYSACVLKAMDERAAGIISRWAYADPFSMYSFLGRPNGWLFNRAGWGTEQFYLAFPEEVVAQVACQWEKSGLWVGWSLAPSLCGKGEGHHFVRQCIRELRRQKSYAGAIYLRVARSNERAVRAYQKAGFVCRETIRDEVAYTGRLEDFWVMALEGSENRQHDFLLGRKPDETALS